jgi:hypothetical protein
VKKEVIVWGTRIQVIRIMSEEGQKTKKEKLMKWKSWTRENPIIDSPIVTFLRPIIEIT